MVHVEWMARFSFSTSICEEHKETPHTQHFDLILENTIAQGLKESEPQVDSIRSTSQLKLSGAERFNNIHSFSFYAASSIVGPGGAGAYLQQSTGERQDTSWTGRQSITGRHTNNHAHTHSHRRAI
ncbi:hypothetical protein AMECASPLE_031941 [Ameca splendens]|uniref:Uncharacterized protein n=1 Tax=Ameca splendens TaxID=208324 RepID=A0ABV0Y6S4_9TELE